MPPHPAPLPAGRSPKATVAQQAYALMEQQSLAEAETLLKRALFKAPGDAELNMAMGDVLASMKRFDEGEPYVVRAAYMRPKDPYCQRNLAQVHFIKGRFDEGCKTYRKTIELCGGTAAAWYEFADVLSDTGRFAKAWEAASDGLRAHPGDPGLVVIGALALMQCARSDEAAELLRVAREAPHNLTNLAVAILYATALNYVARTDPVEAAAAHRRYGQLLVESVRPQYQHARPTTAQADRRLRLAFVSGDFRSHACTYFLEPLLSALDHDTLEVVCYSVTKREDARTDDLRRHADRWVHCAGDSAVELAARIHADKIDVLVELSGLTHDHRLEAVARRPAPVQVTYLGYPNSTGIPVIDRRFVDSITDPPTPRGSDQYAVETLARLDPCFLCFGGMHEAAVAPLPCLGSHSGGAITFGSFNALMKINDPLIRLWTRVVNAVPNSRLVLKYRSLGDPDVVKSITERFTAAGLDPSRLTMLPATAGYREHLESYSHVDIALDTFPYHGTTTTCEAMWMGVPVITLGSSPDVHAARVGVSLLAAVGLPNLVAACEDDFVRIAAELAAEESRQQLTSLRASLRDRMLSSPLCDRRAFAGRFTSAVRSAWREWCGAAQDAS